MVRARGSLTFLAIALFVLGTNPACRLLGNRTTTGTTNTPSTNTQVGRQGTLTMQGGDPPTLDPALASDSTSSTYILEIFSGLVTLDKDLKVVPDVAEKWTLSDDGKTYTFTIRKDAKFHDGKAIKASDFKYSIERSANPRTLSPVADTYLGDIVGVREMLSGRAQAVSGVKVVDDSTLQITIDDAKSHFIAKLTYPTAFVVDKDNIEKGGRTWTDRPNGSGPFKLREWRKGQNIILDRNDSYYGGTVNLKTANFILSGGSAITMYENDEIDVAHFGSNDSDRLLDPKNDLFKQIVKDKDGQAGVAKLSVFYIGFNVKKAPFDDVKVRQALNYAVDKERILNVVLKNLSLRADGILPPGMPGFNPALKSIKYDPAKAKQLLSESKYPDLSKVEISLTAPGAGANPSRYTQAVTEMWKQNLGFDVKIELVEWATFLDDLHAKKYTVFETGWIADYPDPQNFLDILFASKSLDNNTGYANPQFDALIDQAAKERDQDKRFKLYQQAEQIAVEDAAWLPLFVDKEYVLVKPYVQGFVVPAMVVPTLKYVSVNK